MKRLLLGAAVAASWGGLASAQDYTLGISNTVQGNGCARR
jgi:hypothetical protein